MEESRRDRINRVAREWYARNKERLREKKLEQTHDYRRRVRAGRPPKTKNVLVYNTETGDMTPPPPPPRKELSPEHKVKMARGRAAAREEKDLKAKIVQTTKIESGKFLESFT